jgi:GTPase Era involved in 16S rRNA processing
MAMNRMNLLLSKIERRLGTKPLMLPEDINKDKWVDEVIIPDTIATFSRYFPHMVRIQVDSSPENRKDGYYIIDTDLLGGVDILGVKDIAWDVYGNDGLAQQPGNEK